MSRPDHWPARSRAAAAGLVVAAVLLAACSSGPASSAGTSAAPTGAASLQELTQAYLAYAQCARTHGMPDLPDPVVDQHGDDSYPSLDATGSWSWPQSVLTGCASVWDHVHQVRARYDTSHGLAARANHTLSPAQALAFSRCVRLHGFPDFPDPGTGGTVQNLPPGWAKPNLSAAAIAAIVACDPQAGHG